MASEPRGKWQDPPQGYKLKSDIGALCAAVVKEFDGKNFGQFYVSFCGDLAKRYEQYGDKTYLSEKQAAILHKLELNVFPDGVKKVEKPKSDYEPKVYSEEEMSQIPF